MLPRNLVRSSSATKWASTLSRISPAAAAWTNMLAEYRSAGTSDGAAARFNDAVAAYEKSLALEPNPLLKPNDLGILTLGVGAINTTLNLSASPPSKKFSISPKNTTSFFIWN